MFRNLLLNGAAFPLRPYMDAAGEQGGGEGGKPGEGGASPYFPEGMPDDWRGESDQDTIDKVFNIAKGFRERESQRGAVPKSIEDIKLEFSDDLSKHISDKSDPIMDAFKSTVVEAGLTETQINKVINGTLGPLIKDGLIDEPYNPSAELETLGKLLDTDKDGIQKAVEGVTGFAQGLSEQLKDIPDDLRDAAKERLLDLTEDHVGVMLLRSIQGRLTEAGFKVDGGESMGSGLSKEDLKKLDSDERLDPTSPKYDKALQKEYDEAYKRIFG